MNDTVQEETRANLISALERAIDNGVTFCAARFPGAARVKVYANKRGQSQMDRKAQFVIHPWQDEIGPLSDVKLYETDQDILKSEAGENPAEAATILKETSYEDYQNQFALYQNTLRKGKIKKAILSRIKVLEKPYDYNAARMFQQLCESYPAAFVYIYQHPAHGLWMGASPELLIKKRGVLCETVSLAGTKRSTSNRVEWSPKEIEEQELVSEHIRDALHKSGIASFSETGPATLNTGIVSHLKTTFGFELVADQHNPDFLIRNLHPTPAVAGLPVKSAIELISTTEKHERRLYTGYLGEIDGHDSLELYVNLRCMQVYSTQIALHVGGGITINSDLKAEWEETEQKALTLLKFIHE